MIPLSILDLAPVPDGQTVTDALRQSLSLARHGEALGYKRFWMAEHHSMPGIASAATAVALAHVAAGTATIRIGAGGIMLPNHSPLQVAEQFGTLAALHPGRVDLGVGRAPGTDQATAQALRRTLAGDADGFPRDVVELLSYFDQPRPGQKVRAIPGEGLDVPVWILGSSLFGAELAAHLGLPFAFASHFAPGLMIAAIRVYRERFNPSRWLDAPYVMLGFNVIAADSDDAAHWLASSVHQAFVNLRSGRAGKLPRPLAGFIDSLPLEARLMLEQLLSASAIGSPDTVRRKIEAFIADTGADELMITAQIHDHDARRRSYALLAQAVGGLGDAPVANQQGNPAR